MYWERFLEGALVSLVCILVGSLVGGIYVWAWLSRGDGGQGGGDGPPDPFPELDLMDERMKMDVMDRLWEEG